ncbi:MAG: sugar phosphate isomerase/epimerase family protein [Pseudorhodobacter sp.]
MGALAMAYLTLGNVDPFEMVEAAALGGFRATALRMTGHAPGDDWPFDPIRQADRDRMRQVAQSAGIKLVNVSTYRFGPGVTVEDYEPVLHCCAELGISTITANSFAGTFHDVANLIGKVAAKALPLGIRIGIEFIPVSKIRTAQDALEMAQASGMPNVGIVVDALHLARSGGDAAGIARLPAPRLFAVQLCDAPAGGPGDDGLGAEMRAGRLLPGEGELDLAGLMRALPEGVEIEIETPNARYDQLPPAERARIAFEAGQRFLAGGAWM